MSSVFELTNKLAELTQVKNKTQANYLKIIAFVSEKLHSPFLTISQHVPSELFNDPSFFKKAFKITPFSIGFLKNQTQALTNQALKRNIATFEYIQPKFKNYELCLSIISRYPHLLRSVPAKHRTHELLSEALKLDITVFYQMTAKDQLPEFIEEVLASNPYYLQYVKAQTPEMCLSAMKKKPDVFKGVKICDNPNLATTIENLNKLLVKNTIEAIR